MRALSERRKDEMGDLGQVGWSQSVHAADRIDWTMFEDASFDCPGSGETKLRLVQLL